MSDAMKINRRNLIKSSGTSITTFSIYSTVIASQESLYSASMIPSDITIVNNSSKKKSVRVEIFETKAQSNRLYARTFPVQGFRNKDNADDKSYKFEGKIEVKGDGGSYYVVASLPEADGNQLRGNTTIQLIKIGVDPYYEIKINYNETTGLNVYTGG